jgi:predicted O-linked N-acetylglucosamine transferase (SPINDLY family)
MHRRQLADATARKLTTSTTPWRSKKTSAGRLRIGYVSPDFGTHPVAILSAPLFQEHDRSRFEVHAFSLRPDDKSEWRRRIESGVDHFHDLHSLSYAQAIGHVRDAGVDVLVDLAGATTGALPELFAHRAALVQASYLGFPGTSGAGFVDYLICDHVCVPVVEFGAYGEAVVRLPDTFWLCDPGQLPPPSSRAGAGLPEGAVVLYAHHPGYKITPDVFSTWMTILNAVPTAVLWLLEDRPGMAANLQREALERGVHPHRLVFAQRVPYAEYRARIPIADLALDTPLYNGGATTLDALACGLPVLTCAGSGFAGRMAASALRAAGLDDLVVAELRSYADAAIRLALQRDSLDALKQRVARARTGSRLFDVTRRVRELEASYQRMHARALSGEPPASFDV